MKTVSLESASCRTGSYEPLAEVIEHVGRVRFMPALMRFCQHAAGASDCSVFVHRGARPLPVGMARAAGLQPHDVGDCYVRDGFYRVDPAALLAAGGQGALALMHLARHELPDGRWLARYESIGLADRLSLLIGLEHGWAVLNVYRPADCATALDAAWRALAECGMLLAAAVRSHLRLAAPDAAANPFGALSERERQVIDGILAGHSAKQTARRLGLSVTSVATYRQRAFDKLGICRQVQLFALGRSAAA